VTEAPRATHGAHVTLRGVRKAYGDFRALESIDLEVLQGEFLSLLGPSGCGKSTTLGLIAGFLRPDAGTIAFGGRVVNDVPPHRRNIGMVFQSYALFPHLTVFENVAFGLRLRKLLKDQVTTAVRKVLDLVQLQHLQDRYPRQLSGGQQQRVALARAVVLDPQVLLLDEPLSNLDAKLRQEMRVEIVTLQRRIGITTIFVTHDQEEALSISDRVAVMDHGRLVQVGTPREIYTKPATLHVAQFLGASNVFTGTVEGRDASVVVIRTDTGVLMRIAADLCDRPGIGDAALLMVRPEWVTVASRRRHTPKAAEDSLPAVLRRVSYLGSTKLYYVEAAGRQLIAIGLTIADEYLTEGAEVVVSWPFEHARLLAPDQ